MAYKPFEETLAWQKAQDLTIAVFGVFQACPEGWFKNDLMSTTLSVSNLIARGHEHGGWEENIRCLGLAREAVTKFRSMLAMAEKMRLCRESEAKTLLEKANDVSKIVYGFIKHLKEKAASAA